MSLLTLEAKLERQESTTPWGFRMQGGKDFSSPLTIARVTPGSLAAKCGLQQGDLILKIGNKASDILKHKDAQDTIISYGNKLDLLLQRIREKKKMQNGYGGGAPTYETFSTPVISSYQSPASTPGGGSSTYSSAPKPFSSSALNNKPSPAPYSSNAEINLSKQTQNLNISTPSYSKYVDVEEKPNQSTQSRSFKFLRDTLESGQEPPSALRPTVDLRRSPSPTPGVNRQFNTPIGLYSNDNVVKQQNLTVSETRNGSAHSVTSSSSMGETLFPRKAKSFDPGQPARTAQADQSQYFPTSDTEEEAPKFDAQGKRLYRPSETFKLIQEQENVSEKPKDKPVAPHQTRTIKVLEKQLEGEEQAPPPPASVQNRAPAAPKPGVWSPGQPAGGAPTAKPFVPSVAPPAPAPVAPRIPPAKPSGVGAVRGKIGDAVIKSDSTRVPVCASCGTSIRGPFVTAMGKCWCPDCFVCANPKCGMKLIDIGFVEEGGFLYCEKDYALYFAPHCAKCGEPIVGECVNALNKQYHPGCFLCYHCKEPIGGNQFHLEDGNPYCETHWRQMFQTMCNACDFPIEPGDKWVEALNQNYHSECFNCSTCQVNLEGQAFYAKGGKPFCKKHAR